jgi:hypothetical protein
LFEDHVKGNKMKYSIIAVFVMVLLSNACASDPPSTASSQSGYPLVAGATKLDPPTAAGPKALCLGFPDQCRR